jgi:hypothetical protein
MRFQRAHLLVLLLAFLGPASALEWQTSSGVNGINVTSVHIGGSRVFATLDSGQFFMSKDWGQSWIKLALKTRKVIALAAAKDSLFIATPAGLFSSDDSGSKWVSSGNGINSGFGLTGLVSMQSQLFASTGKGTLQKSANAGKSWEMVRDGLDSISAIGGWDSLLFVSARVGLLRYNLNNQRWDTLVPSTPSTPRYKGFAIFAGKMYAASYGRGIHVSADKGATWAKVDYGYPDTLPVTGLVAGSKAIYAATMLPDDDYDGWYGVHVSRDSGKTWDSCLSESVLGLAAEGEKVFAATENAYISKHLGQALVSHNSGKDWYTGLPRANPVYSIAANDTAIAVGTGSPGGVHTSSDMGRLWKEANGELPATYRITGRPFNYVLYTSMGVAFWGPYLFSASHNSWEGAVYRSLYRPGKNLDWSTTHDKRQYRFLFKGEGKLYSLPASTDWGIFVTGDTGRTWKSLSGSMPDGSSPTAFFTEGGDYFLGKQGWADRRDTVSGGAYYSEDSCCAWKSMAEGFPRFVSVNGLLAHDLKLFAATDQGVYQKPGGTGGRWVRILSVKAQAIHAHRSTLIVGTSTGAQLSQDGGQTWETALTGGSVISFAANSRTLYAGTDSGSVLWTELDRIPVRLASPGVGPGPGMRFRAGLSGGAIRFDYFLERAADVRLRVLTLSGKILASRELRRRPAGAGHALVPCGALPNGIRIATLTAGKDRASALVIRTDR